MDEGPVRRRVDLDPTIAFDTEAGVYRPAEDTFLLLESIALETGERFLEVGTGSGLVALHAARRNRACATDANREAVRLARANARRNGLLLEVVLTNLLAGIRGPFDVVACNPPYLPGRPMDDLDRAWQGGLQGSDVSMQFLDDLDRVLSPSGRAYLLLSGLNKEARRAAETRFRTRVVAARRLFFEELEVLELRRRDPSRASPTSRPSAHSRVSSGPQGLGPGSSR